MKNKIIFIAVIALISIILGGFVIAKTIGADQVQEQLKLGYKYMEEGKYEEAVLAFKKAIEIDEKNADARIKLSELYILHNKVNEAVRVLEEGYENTKNNEIKDILDSLNSKLTPPNVNIKGGNYEKELRIELSKALPHGDIFYTLDGTQPQTDSTKYTGPIEIREGETTIRAVAITDGIISKEITEVYSIKAKTDDKKLVEVSLDNELKRNLNEYFTVFSRVFFSPFSENELNDDLLIDFGISVFYNDPDRTQGYDGFIDSKRIDELVFDFFGKRIEKHKTIGTYELVDGYYKIALASGEGYRFSQVYKLFDMGGGYYKAYINTFIGTSGFTSDINLPYSELLEQEGYVDIGGKFSAVIKKTNSRPGYNLIEYKLFDYASESSSYLTENTKEFKPESVIDGDVKTPWVEGAEGDGIGEWIILRTEGKKEIRGIDLINGYAKSQTSYSNNNRVKKVRLEFSDGSSVEKGLEDNQYDYQTILLDKPVETEYVRITIMDVYKGTKYQDTCISEVCLY